MAKKFIKVTVKGKEPIVILASNESFYRSQPNVTIEEPSEKEIAEHFPEFAKKPKGEKTLVIQETEEYKELKKQLDFALETVAILEAEKAEFVAEKATLEAKIVELTPKK